MKEFVWLFGSVVECLLGTVLKGVVVECCLLSVVIC